MPIAGIANMYTSGWNVNQNRCWYAIGSPPIAGLKKPEMPNLSVYSIMRAAANVGIATRIMIEVTRVAHTKSGALMSGRSGCFIFNMVTMKLIEPRIEEIPSILSPKIHISAAGPGALMVEYGGVAYQVKSAMPSHTKAIAGGIIQNATAFNFGQAMSLYLTIMGIR